MYLTRIGISYTIFIFYDEGKEKFGRNNTSSKLFPFSELKACLILNTSKKKEIIFVLAEDSLALDAGDISLMIPSALMFYDFQTLVSGITQYSCICA